MSSTAQAKLLTLEQISEGDSYSESSAITQECFDQFIQVSGDRALIHVDARHAAKMGFPGCLVHGFMGTLPYSRILGMYLPGSNTVIHQLQLEMIAPVFIGDILTYEVKVNRVIPGVKAVRLSLTATNQGGTVVNRGTAMCVFRP
jgi:acyl dehydratase